MRNNPEIRAFDLSDFLARIHVEGRPVGRCPTATLGEDIRSDADMIIIQPNNGFGVLNIPLGRFPTDLVKNLISPVLLQQHWALR